MSLNLQILDHQWSPWTISNTRYILDTILYCCLCFEPPGKYLYQATKAHYLSAGFGSGCSLLVYRWFPGGPKWKIWLSIVSNERCCLWVLFMAICPYNLPKNYFPTSWLRHKSALLQRLQDLWVPVYWINPKTIKKASDPAAVSPDSQADDADMRSMLSTDNQDIVDMLKEVLGRQTSKLPQCTC